MPSGVLLKGLKHDLLVAAVNGRLAGMSKDLCDAVLGHDDLRARGNLDLLGDEELDDLLDQRGLALLSRA